MSQPTETKVHVISCRADRYLGFWNKFTEQYPKYKLIREFKNCSMAPSEINNLAPTAVVMHVIYFDIPVTKLDTPNFKA
jgi:hypothetical protein